MARTSLGLAQSNTLGSTSARIKSLDPTPAFIAQALGGGFDGPAPRARHNVIPPFCTKNSQPYFLPEKIYKIASNTESHIIS